MLLLISGHVPPRAAAPQPRARAAGSKALVLTDEPTWLVADKPAGVNVHEGADCLLAQLKEFGGWQSLFPVHRLDRETSGVTLIAKTSEAAAELQAALQSSDALKCYRGVLTGVPGGKKKRGLWDSPLSNRAEGRRNPRGLSAERVEAVTEYTVVAENGFISCCDFLIRKGGRTHQIRKHAAADGVPVFGDARYGDNKRNEQLAKRYGFSGMALHAALLKITTHGVQYTFRAPLPSSWAPIDLGWPSEP